jgi:hypothetical protein
MRDSMTGLTGSRRRRSDMCIEGLRRVRVIHVHVSIIVERCSKLLHNLNILNDPYYLCRIQSIAWVTTDYCVLHPPAPPKPSTCVPP